MAEIQIGEGHNGAAIAAKSGDVLVIRLPENPTTGFQWSVEQADARVLQLQSQDYMPPAGGALGAGGMRVYRYLAKAPGGTVVALQLARSWEAAAPRSQFKIAVTVGP